MTLSCIKLTTYRTINNSCYNTRGQQRRKLLGELLTEMQLNCRFALRTNLECRRDFIIGIKLPQKPW